MTPDLTARQRTLAGTAIVVLGLPVMTAVLVDHRDDMSLAVPALLVLLLVLASALVGGLRVAVPAALVSAVTLVWFFIPPFGTLEIDSPSLLTALVVFLAVAVSVSFLVDLAARRAGEADRARAQATALTAVAEATVSAQRTLPTVLEQARQLFGMREVALVERTPMGWQVVEAVAESELPAQGEAEVRVPAGPGLELRAHGPELFAADLGVLGTFATAAASALEGRRLAERAAEAAGLRAADSMRTALLAAVGHDLRTPLAVVKAAVGSLRTPEVSLSAEETDELLATIEDGADRLGRLLANLLDASRLQAGMLSVALEPVGVDEVVGRALLGLADSSRVYLDVPEDLPPVLTDLALAERVVANVLENALRYAPRGTIVTVRAGGLPTRPGATAQVLCEVVDHGPGVPKAKWEQVFGAFQRAGDRVPGGVGLGLSVARGFAHATGATLTPAETPGGGLTMRYVLPVAADEAQR